MPYASARKYLAEERFRRELQRAKAAPLENILFCGLPLTVLLWLVMGHLGWVALF